MTGIIDYDAGNLKSVEKAFGSLGEYTVITRKREEILNCNRIVLPGVGSFGDAMEKLDQYGLTDVIREAVKKGIPLLGICLGMQLLFESSEESPLWEGLGICKGKILGIPSESSGSSYKIPHMGWNSLTYDNPGRLFTGIPEDSYVYFVHSYYLKAEDPAIVTASTFYSVKIDASVEQQNVFGCQFHPEKSGQTGLSILKNFLKL